MMNLSKIVAAVALTTLVLSGVAKAQDNNSDIVGTWVAVSDITIPARTTEPAYSVSIWQFRNDGTLTQIDTAFGGYMALPGKDPIEAGINAPYLGDWTRNEDGTIRIVAVKFEGQISSDPIPGALGRISKVTDHFDPSTGDLFHCLQMVQVENGVFKPDTDHPNTITTLETCPGDHKIVTRSKLTRLQ